MWIGVLVLLLGGCSGSNDTPPSTNQATATRTQVAGLLVLDRHVQTHADDALGTPPINWRRTTDGTAFDRALAHADWQVREVKHQRGTTGPDGRFTVDHVPPGTYTLDVTKTLNGNLVTAAVPFVVGDTDMTTMVAEFSQGLVRTISTYRSGSREVQDIRSPYGHRLVISDGRVQTLSDGVRTFKDANGDGQFEHCEISPDSGPCLPVAITAITVGGDSPVILEQTTWVYAIAHLSDDTAIDVTALATWESSNASVARVDAWGLVTTLGLGTTQLTATLAGISSAPWPFQVVERPPLVRLHVTNVSCVYALLRDPTDIGVVPPPVVVSPIPGGDTPTVAPEHTTPDDDSEPVPDDEVSTLPAPGCTSVVEVGNTLHFSATGEFRNAEGTLHVFADLTQAVTWQATPAAVGAIVHGRFTARQAGTTQILAALGEVTSEAVDVQVVTAPTLIDLAIYTSSGQVVPVFLAAESGVLREEECPDCGFTITVLRGDQLPWYATAFYDTGTWRDVTPEVAWHSTEPAVAVINSAGVMTAQAAGITTITARQQDTTSQPAEVQVVNAATLQSLWIMPEGNSHVVEHHARAFFRASGFYDVGFEREVTTEAAWHSSDERLGRFEAPGVFTGRAAGRVEVWATLAEQQSERLTIEVFGTSTLNYCDAEHINHAVWSDAFNRVVLESDCAVYTRPGVVALRYTVTEIQPQFGIFDPCLDLYVYQDGRRIRTLREEGCGEPFLAPTAAEFAEERLLYQWQAFWDLKTDTGAPVPTGTYTIYGRFYLYYDPVVQLALTVQ
jgi:hypothetical protein